VCCTAKRDLKTFTDAVAEKFKITVVDDVKEYLGIHMESLVNGDVKLTQPKLLGSLPEEYVLVDCPSSSRG
jgi:hypothetical protein